LSSAEKYICAAIGEVPLPDGDLGVAGTENCPLGFVYNEVGIVKEFRCPFKRRRRFGITANSFLGKKPPFM
jgi:hypothetical protein